VNTLRSVLPARILPAAPEPEVDDRPTVVHNAEFERVFETDEQGDVKLAPRIKAPVTPSQRTFSTRALVCITCIDS